MPRIKNYCNPDMLGKPAPEPRRQVRSQGLENDIIQFCGICPVDINGRKKWLARDVARALELSKIRA